VSARKRIPPGWNGWIAVGTAVVIAELVDDRTMSEAFHYASRNRYAGPLMAVSWGVLSAHLFGVIPARFDPLHIVFSHYVARKCTSCRARTCATS